MNKSILTDEFMDESNWLTPKACAALTGHTITGLAKRRTRGQWPPFSVRAGRPRYPGDYIRREMAKGVVSNTVQAANHDLAPKTTPPRIIPPQLLGLKFDHVDGKPIVSVLWRPNNSAAK